MEEIQTRLVNLGYNDNISVENFSDGAPNLVFVKIVAWLSSELVALCEFENHVSSITDMEDLLGFLVEVSSLLKELGCPYKNLVKGQVTDRLIHSDDKKLLITYLCTELEASKIQALKNPKMKEAPLQIELDESRTAKELREMLVFLRFPKPPDTITPQQLFCEVEKKLKTVCQPSTPKEKVGDLLFTGCLTEKQWFQLEHLYKEMYQEYKTRRNLLLTRLEVTVRSFLWADRLKNKSDDILSIYCKRRNGIIVEPSVKISHVLSSKTDLTIIDKTSSASVRKNTKSSVNKVVIGAVPDRGGRPEEQQPPPPEVPSWQKSDSSSRGGMKPSNQQSSGNFKNTSYSRDETSNSRFVESNYKGDNSSFNRGGRNDYNAAPSPIYQPVNYYAQFGNPQYGFGGYMAAGDNFQQYGMSDGINQYQARGASHGSGPRHRGGYSDRGTNQSRGRSRGRGRY